jgi:transcription initiation factor IIE alpha subunit
MINLKSKQVKKTKHTNNEKWYTCNECNFTFTIYKQMGKGRTPLCPNCGDNVEVVKIVPNAINSRESYQPWTNEEIEVVRKVVNRELLPYQGALILDRSISSVACKARRMRRKGEF